MANALTHTLCQGIVSRLEQEIILADRSGRILYANERAREGIDGEIEERRLRDIFSDTDPAPLEKLDYAMSSTQWMPANLTFAHGSLAGVEVKFRARGYREDGQVRLLLIGDRNRDEGFRQLRDLVRRLNDELAEKRDLAHRLQRALDSEANLHRELIHRVKNNLALLTALVSLRRNATPDEAVEQALKDLEMRIHAIRAVHDILDQAGEISKVQAGELIRALCSQLDNSVMPENVTVENELLDVTLDVDKATPLSLLINELITNAAKHAFPEGKPGTIVVSLQKNGEDKLEVGIVDNGRGAQGDFTQVGTGSRIIEALADQIGGELKRVSDDKGTHWSFIFPHDKPEEDAGLERGGALQE